MNGDEKVVEFPDGTPEAQIDFYASEWADDNAMSFGDIEWDDEDADEDNEYREAYSEFEILSMSREEIEEEYGEIEEP